MSLSLGGCAADVGLQMPDRRLLLRDDPVHEVADRDDADHDAVFHHGKMPYAVIRDRAHAIAYRVSQGDEDHGAAHDFGDGRLLRQLALENYLAGIIALRDDAEQLAMLHH